MNYESWCSNCKMVTTHSVGVCLQCNECRGCGRSGRQEDHQADPSDQNTDKRDGQPKSKATESWAYIPFSETGTGRQSLHRHYASRRPALQQGSEQSALGRQTSDPGLADVVAQIGIRSAPSRTREGIRSGKRFGISGPTESPQVIAVRSESRSESNESPLVSHAGLENDEPRAVAERVGRGLPRGRLRSASGSRVGETGKGRVS